MSHQADAHKRFSAGGVIVDGGLGTMLIADGLEQGAPPEAWNESKPDALSRLHRAYLEAGCDVISTNTFGGNPSRLKTYGLDERLRTINTAGVRLARDAVEEFVGGYRQGPETGTRGDSGDGSERFVALSLGPTGRMLPPVGQASEAEIAEEFAAQIQSIDDGFDLVLIETMYDVREALAALHVAKKVNTRPVAVSLTYNRNPRGFFTVMGDEASEVTRRLGEAGADIVGANCSITSHDMIDLAEVLRRSTDLPLLCQPNAGQPTLKDRMPVYDQTAQAFADDALRLFDKGINAVGGCCGTTPDFMRELARRLR